MSATVGTRSTCSQLRSLAWPSDWPGALMNSGTHRTWSTLPGGGLAAAELRGLEAHAVVGGDHEQGVVVHALLLEPPHDLADQPVGLAGLHEVALARQLGRPGLAGPAVGVAAVAPVGVLAPVGQVVPGLVGQQQVQEVEGRLVGALDRLHEVVVLARLVAPLDLLQDGRHRAVARLDGRLGLGLGVGGEPGPGRVLVDVARPHDPLEDPGRVAQGRLQAGPGRGRVPGRLAHLGGAELGDDLELLDRRRTGPAG